MNPKLKTLFFFLIGAFAGILSMYLISNYKIEKRNQHNNKIAQESINNNFNFSSKKPELSNISSLEIESITNEKTVIAYVKLKHQLPDFYITKSEAKKQGWIPSKGNLCEVLPGKAIGGDYFSNREKQLPKNEQYFEADVNYNCGNRNADRIIFTKNGDVWLTKNHYKTFEKQ